MNRVFLHVFRFCYIDIFKLMHHLAAATNFPQDFHLKTSAIVHIMVNVFLLSRSRFPPFSLFLCFFPWIGGFEIVSIVCLCLSCSSRPSRRVYCFMFCCLVLLCCVLLLLLMLSLCSINSGAIYFPSRVPVFNTK